MFKDSSQRQSGFTLLELLLVIGIGGVVLATLGIMLHKVSADNRMASAERLVNTIAAEASAYRTVKGSYSGLGCNLWETSSSNCTFVENNVLKSSQTNPYGGHISLGEAGNSGESFNVAFQKIPASACMPMLMDANKNKNLTKIQLHKGTQDIIIDTVALGSFGPGSPGGSGGSGGCGGDGSGGTAGRGVNIPTNLPINGTGTPSTSSCIAENNGYNLTVIDSFPISAEQASGYCSGNEEHVYTFVWTFG